MPGDSLPPPQSTWLAAALTPQVDPCAHVRGVYAVFAHGSQRQVHSQYGQTKEEAGPFDGRCTSVPDELNRHAGKLGLPIARADTFLLVVRPGRRCVPAEAGCREEGLERSGGGYGEEKEEVVLTGDRQSRPCNLCYARALQG